MNNKPQIIFHLIGWHGQGAHGDDLLAMVVRQIFSEAAMDCGIDLSWSQTPRESDYIIVGGGTLLGIDNMGILETLQECRKPYSIFGTGFRREKRDIGQANIIRLKTLIEKADFAFFRGYLSKQFCLHTGIRQGEVIGDPALHFRPVSSTAVEGDSGFKVGVSIRSMDNQSEPQYTDNAQCLKMVCDIANFIGGQKDCTFYFFDMARNMYDSDQAAIESLMPMIHTRRPQQLVGFNEGAEKSFSTLTNMDYLISQRLHPSIIAWASGIPHVPLDYQNGKTEDFLSTLGMTEFGLRTDDFTLDAYQRKWFRLTRDHAIVSTHALRSVSYWKDMQSLAARKIMHNFIGA